MKRDSSVTKILFFPIEQLEERYSLDWFKWFLSEFERNNSIDVEVFNPVALTDTIRDGSFLDVCGTQYYKAQQIANFSHYAYNLGLEDGDVIFLMDAWFPGLESIAYIRDGLRKDIKICGIFHAGTYDQFDFIAQKGMGYWGKPLEESWLRILDKVFVATEFHKRLLMTTRDVDPNKIVVTGLPTGLDHTKFVLKGKKENIVVFPHRLDSEKKPDWFLNLQVSFNDYAEQYRFLYTKDFASTKENYYKLLCKSKIAVSFAEQETFGIAMIESVMAGCFPVVPNTLSYKELYHPLFQYGSFNEAVSLIKNLMLTPDKFVDAFGLTKGKLNRITLTAIPNMINEMIKLSKRSRE